ncbi:uncharacterized protein BCR38DRAFT_489821 [Pseudomassariella vexata]|uniref:Uncharacterized protein n=1 Tax=Pseudomassariella vexata TaxID=1141098 RepID=A0A1Y2DF63_9PEZI|nr:uncharacterized protein BCR38DRAFT_489821 [Pseudomassariella vexata]ORY57827.1 hypothetical protein BCR38DRAFT_489821 [Pseudomassariella vexata]
MNYLIPLRFGAPKKTQAPTGLYKAEAYNAQVRRNLKLPEKPAKSLPDLPQSPTVVPIPMRTPLTRRPQYAAELRDQSGPSSKKTWCTESLSEEGLAELFGRIHRHFGHIRYAICGLSCMIDHGFQGRAVAVSSILCPVESKDVIKSWAASWGCDTQRTPQDSIFITMKDGSVRRVRVKYLEHGFERLQLQESRISSATVLSLASQIEYFTEALIKHGPNTPDKHHRNTAQGSLSDVMWCLRHAADTRAALHPSYMESFLSDPFFTLFTDAHEDAKFEMQRAGIDVASVLASIRQAADIREHAELLRSAGVSPAADALAPVQQPRMFHGTNRLGDEKPTPVAGKKDSIYTLRSKGSRTDVSTNPTAGSLQESTSTAARILLLQRAMKTRRPPLVGRHHQRTVSIDSVSERVSVDLVSGRNTPADWL